MASSKRVVVLDEAEKKVMPLIVAVRTLDRDAGDFLLTLFRDYQSRGTTNFPSFTLSEYLDGIIAWKETPQGYDYWHDLCCRLDNVHPECVEFPPVRETGVSNEID